MTKKSEKTDNYVVEPGVCISYFDPKDKECKKCALAEKCVHETRTRLRERKELVFETDAGDTGNVLDPVFEEMVLALRREIGKPTKKEAQGATAYSFKKGKKCCRLVKNSEGDMWLVWGIAGKKSCTPRHLPHNSSVDACEKEIARALVYFKE